MPKIATDENLARRTCNVKKKISEMEKFDMSTTLWVVMP
jgi:hypothetical protein